MTVSNIYGGFIFVYIFFVFLLSSLTYCYFYFLAQLVVGGFYPHQSFSGQAMVTRTCRPFSSPVRAFIFCRAEGSAFPLQADFPRMCS